MRFPLLTIGVILQLILGTFCQFPFPLPSPIELVLPQFEGPERVACPLEWVPSSNGDSPDENIVAFNTDEIVARLDISGIHLVGRLSPEDGLTYASLPSDGSVHSSQDYEVLTNPSGCVVEWINSNGDLPKYYVDNGGKGIGKSYFTDSNGNINNVGGSVVDREGLFVSFQGRQEHSKGCQVLTSTYPLLEGSLYNFTFIHKQPLVPNWIEVLESETIKKAVGFEQSEEIRHRGIVEEIFELSESTLHWKGIDKMAIKFSSTLGNFETQPITIEDGNNFRLVTIQNKEMQFMKALRFAEGQSGLIQICSAVKMLVGQELQFSATAKFVGPIGMTGSQVKTILEASGRNPVHVNGHEAYTVIQGTLSGKFILEKSSASLKVEHSVSCHSIFTIPQ